MKICNKCKIERNLDDYNIRSSTKKLNTICKFCEREYKLKHYYNNKESHFIRNNKTNKKLKQIVLEYKLNNSCKVCNETHPACLDFHHLDPKLKTKEIGVIMKWGSSKKLLEEIDKCIILCSNCHRKLHAGVIKLGD